MAALRLKCFKVVP